MSGEYQWNLQTFFPFITRKRGCNQPTDRKTGLTVTTPFLLLLSTVFKAIPWTTGSKSVRQAAAGSRTCLFVRGGWDPAGCTHQGHILSPAEKSRLGDSLWSRHRPPTAGPCPEPVSPDAVDPVPVPWPLSFRLGSSVNKNHWVPVPAVSHPGFLKKAGDQNEAAPRDPQNRRYTAFPFRDLRTAKNRKPPALAFRFSGNGLPAGGFFLLSLFQ